MTMIREMIGYGLIWLLAQILNALDVVAPWLAEDFEAGEQEEAAHACH